MMKKLLILTMALALGTSVSSYAQHAEAAPAVGTIPGQGIESTNDLFDLHFNYDIGDELGANGNAGVIFFNGEYWVSAWASALIHVLNSDGEYEETMSIPGVSGVRSFTTDGTSIYAGTASNRIYEIDHATRELTNTINISGGNARMLAYDPTLDGGNGGFWTGDFSNDINSFAKTGGSPLSTIPNGAFNAAVYGGAVDLVSDNGPFLWIFDQSPAGGEALARQLELPAGTPTGLVYDYNTSGHQPPGNTSIAGGLFITDEIVAGKVTFVGIGQGTPSDQLFVVELADALGVNDNNLSTFNLFPNPVSGGVVNIETAVSGEKTVVVYDVLGKQVINTSISGKELNVSSLQSGLYMVSVTQNESTITKKLIVQ